MRSETQEEFTEFVSDRWSSLVRTAVFLGCGPHEAQDVVQTALTRCLVKWTMVRSARDRDSYVYRVLVNCLHDRKRRRWNTEHPSDVLVDGVIADPADQIAIADAVHRGLASLTSEHRDVLVLRYFADLTEGQVAVALGIPEGTVKSRLSRARSELASSSELSALSKGESDA